MFKIRLTTSAISGCMDYIEFNFILYFDSLESDTMLVR
jgi:hypothetical protein